MEQAVPDIKISSNDPLEKSQGIFCLQSLVLLLTFFTSFTFQAQPRIEIAEAKKNFGTVKRGEVIRNDYVITNTGTEPLVFTDIEIPCSCTTAEYSKQPVLPGQKTTVTLIFNTATVYGRQDRTVLLKSNDPKSPLKLRYKGNVSEKK